MKKENENIHRHIINEDYKALKKKQNQHFEVSGKKPSHYLNYKIIQPLSNN